MIATTVFVSMCCGGCRVTDSGSQQRVCRERGGRRERRRKAGGLKGEMRLRFETFVLLKQLSWNSSVCASRSLPGLKPERLSVS